MGVAKILVHSRVFVAMQSLSGSFGDGKIIRSGYVPACGARIPDFCMESLRHIPVAIISYIGTLSMSSCALFAASKMVHSWYHCKVDDDIGDDGRECE